jgi:3-oxoacyl-[acyl-carrier-protein] synthase-3
VSAYLQRFGACLPSRVVTNTEISALAGCDAAWIREVSGIEERRWAGDAESVADLAFEAARRCLGELPASAIGLILLASGSAERRFPGPASTLAHRLGLDSTPAIDIPMASAGSLFALDLARRLAPEYGSILVVAAEKMSSVVLREPMDRSTAILFGDGAGACLVTAEAEGAQLELLDSTVSTDGAYAEDLKLGFSGALEMNGRSVILQAGRKIPRAIAALLEKNGRTPAEVSVFLMHQANQNLMMRVAQALGVPPERFYSAIGKYGNTSSASMLIAAEEYFAAVPPTPGLPVVFAAFGAGFHWGALLAAGRSPNQIHPRAK